MATARVSDGHKEYKGHCALEGFISFWEDKADVQKKPADQTESEFITEIKEDFKDVRDNRCDLLGDIPNGYTCNDILLCGEGYDYDGTT